MKQEVFTGGVQNAETTIFEQVIKLKKEGYWIDAIAVTGSSNSYSENWTIVAHKIL